MLAKFSSKYTVYFIKTCSSLMEITWNQHCVIDYLNIAMHSAMVMKVA